MRARPRSRRRSPAGQADVATIIVLASLGVAVFACFFLIGRAASPHPHASESMPRTVDAVVSAVPVRMSSAPAIAAAIAPSQSRKPRPAAARTPAAVVAVTPVSAPTEPVGTPERAQTTPVRTSAPAKSPEGGGSTTQPSSGGPGTSFDTSG